MVAFDPEQAPGGVSDGDDDSRVGVGLQQAADHLHRARERVPGAVRLDLGVGEFERRQRFGADEVVERPAPRVLHDAADLRQPWVCGVPPDELVVCTRDEQARGLG